MESSHTQKAGRLFTNSSPARSGCRQATLTSGMNPISTDAQIIASIPRPDGSGHIRRRTARSILPASMIAVRETQNRRAPQCGMLRWAMWEALWSPVPRGLAAAAVGAGPSVPTPLVERQSTRFLPPRYPLRGTGLRGRGAKRFTVGPSYGHLSLSKAPRSLALPPVLLNPDPQTML